MSSTQRQHASCVTTNSAILLDTNAGIKPTNEILEEYIRLSLLTNNVYGFTDTQMQLMQQLREAHDYLANRFAPLINSDGNNNVRVIFTSGASETIKQLCSIFGNKLYAYPGQHPLVEKLIGKQDDSPPLFSRLVCLINLVDSTTGEYHYNQLQEARKKFKYLIIDYTQAIGKKTLPPNIKADCLFFSAHKIGAVYGTGFLICSNDFYNNFIAVPNGLNKSDENEEQDMIAQDLSYGGTINYPAYLTTVQALKNIGNYDISAYQKIWQKLYNGLCGMSDEIENVQPQPRTPQTYNTILFEFKEKNREILCPRSFQHVLAEKGYQIGFKTACSANSTGQLRISFLLSQLPANFDVNDFLQTFRETITEVRERLKQQQLNTITISRETSEDDDNNTNKAGGYKLYMPSNPNFIGGKTTDQTQNALNPLYEGGNNDATVYETSRMQQAGGDRDATTTEFFNEVNSKNNFYMNSHWVPSHDEPPQISMKYAKMFQKELFNTPIEISLSIPPHNDTHRKEIDVQKAKYSDQLYDMNDDKVYIQQRRLARSLWINNPDAEITLTLENFETITKELYFAPELFEYISNNKLTTNKRKPDTQFTQSDANEERSTQATLTRQLKLKHYNISMRNYPKTLLQDIVIATDPQHQTDIENLTKHYQKESSDIADDVAKQDFINFQISIANVDFLQKLSPRALSDTILYNLRPRPTKLHTYAKNYNPHQKLVIDENFYDAYTLDGNWLTAINTQYSYIKLNKTIAQPLIISTNISNKSTSADDIAKRNNVKLYYCDLQNAPSKSLKTFIENHRQNQACLYTLYTTEDDITEDYGDFNWLLQNGFKHEIKQFTYYDVWEQRFYDDTTIVCFTRVNPPIAYAEIK